MPDNTRINKRQEEDVARGGVLSFVVVFQGSNCVLIDIYRPTADRHHWFGTKTVKGGVISLQWTYIIMRWKRDKFSIGNFSVELWYYTQLTIEKIIEFSPSSDTAWLTLVKYLIFCTSAFLKLIVRAKK